MALPEYSLVYLLVIQATLIAAIALIIKRLYRSATSTLFTSEPITIPKDPNDLHVHDFVIEVCRDRNGFGHSNWLFWPAVRRFVRWLVHSGSGIATLCIADWLFFPATGRAARWADYESIIIVVLVLMLIVGRLRSRLTSSGLWTFAFILGFAWGITLFGVVFVSIPAILEKLKQGLRDAVFAILDAVLIFGIATFCLRLIFQMAKGILWLHRWLAVHIHASSVYIGMAFFWAWVCYFILSYQLSRDAPFEKLAKFMLVPLLIYALIISVLLWVVNMFMPTNVPVGLLFLRSFSRVRKSEQLFSGLALDWTELGPLYVLSGPDIAKDNLDSKMLTAFLFRNLLSEFISNIGDLESRLSGIQKQRGWDLRYRVEEFKCTGKVWTNAFEKLLEYSDVILVDLRGFDERNTGTAFELFTLLRSGQSHRTLLLCDRQTNVLEVERIAKTASAHRVVDSCNSNEAISLIEVNCGGNRLRRFTMRLLLSIASPGKVPALSDRNV